jgi:hypothetical protein
MRSLLPFLLIFAFTSNAQTPAPAAAAPEAPKLGWTKSGNLGVNLSFSQSSDVVGQTDGSSQTYGTDLKAGFNRRSEGDEWRNDFNLKEATTKTPSVPRFVKSADELKIGTTYLYFLKNHPEFGPYAKGEASAPVFKGENVQADTKNYRITGADGSVRTVSGTSIRLTDGFKPLTTKESVGGFWKAIDREMTKLEFRIGAAALQIDASGQYAVGATNAAGEIEVTELRDVNQAGLESAVSFKGKVDEKTSYELGLETLTPFINNKIAGDNREALALTNVTGVAKLNSNITSWASFGYSYNMKLEPQLLARAQQTHMLVLNASYNLF